MRDERLCHVPCEDVAHYLVTKRFAGHNESRTRRLGRPKKRLDHLANLRARHRDPNRRWQGKAPLICHQFQRDNRDYRNGQLSYVLSFSLTVISSESASKSDPLSLVATCDFK